MRRAGKPLLWIAAAGPMLWLIRGAVAGDLGHDPVRTITRTTGLTTLVLLFATLLITPLRRVTGVQALGLLRRPTGLWAFGYALLHFLTYAVFDRQFSLAGLGDDIVKRPWITVGFTAFLLLGVLASTSPHAVVRRIGGRRWQRLHRLVYVAAALGVLHFLWLVKRDTREPMIYAGVLVLLLLARTRLPGAGRAPAAPVPRSGGRRDAVPVERR